MFQPIVKSLGLVIRSSFLRTENTFWHFFHLYLEFSIKHLVKMHSLNLRILSQNWFQPNVVHTIAKFSKSRPALDPTTVKRSAGGCLNDFWPIYFEVHCNLEVIRVHWCNVWSSSHYKQLTSGFFDPPWRKLMMMPRRRRRQCTVGWIAQKNVQHIDFQKKSPIVLLTDQLWNIWKATYFQNWICTAIFKSSLDKTDVYQLTGRTT